MPGAKRWRAVVKEFKEKLRDQLFRFKFRFASGQTDVLEKMRRLKRDIARLETILAERGSKAKA